MTQRILMTSGLLTALLTGPAWAVDLYGVTDVALFTVDPATGVAVEVGPLTPAVPGLLGGLEWADGTLYGLSGSPGNRLYRVDAASGAVEEIGPLGGGGAIFEGALAYDGQSMWGVNFGIFGGPKSLVSIDLATGAATVVGPLASGNVDFNGLAVANGELFGIERITNALWQIDRSDPAQSRQIGPGFGVQIDLGVKGGMAGPYAYADDTVNFFEVDFQTGTAQVLAGTNQRFRALAPMGEPCPADVNGDRVVDVQDLLSLLAAWGPCPGCPEDVNDDGIVDVQDLLLLLAAWGPCP